MINSGEKILLTLWVGGLWFAGYVVVPVLFQVLDKKTAGLVAGQVFTVTSYIGIVCSGLLLMSLLAGSTVARLKNYRIWILVGMLLLILAGQFILTPMMVELKQTGLSSSADAAASFARLHGVSSVMFLINSILGLILVVVGLHPDNKIISQSV